MKQKLGGIESGFSHWLFSSIKEYLIFMKFYISLFFFPVNKPFIRVPAFAFVAAYVCHDSEAVTGDVFYFVFCVAFCLVG